IKLNSNWLRLQFKERVGISGGNPNGDCAYNKNILTEMAKLRFLIKAKKSRVSQQNEKSGISF
ncbi:MAG: hypothetical protein PUA81_00170, partial [Oscillospiraceae bacterium]|nr:hypothetical protein [Oscillospiraceae bacterium]